MAAKYTDKTSLKISIQHLFNNWKRLLRNWWIRFSMLIISQKLISCGKGNLINLTIRIMMVVGMAIMGGNLKLVKIVLWANLSWVDLIILARRIIIRLKEVRVLEILSPEATNGVRKNKCIFRRKDKKNRFYNRNN